MRHIIITLTLLSLCACTNPNRDYTTHCLPDNYIVLGNNNGAYTWCIPDINYISIELYGSIEEAVDAGVEHYYRAQDLQGTDWDWYVPQCYTPDYSTNKE
jgi:hypothetical protein